MLTAEELRVLDAEELSSRLKGARRELYELRFKLAVGQLENNRHVHRVRKDIARILTVVHERKLGEAVDRNYAAAQPSAPTAVELAPASADPDSATPESVETPAEAGAVTEAEAKPKRTRAKKSAEGTAVEDSQ
ncbi:MAG TPA: 50S ribosomal protein L29 [Candidatus Acidoferrales bacterium]|nr:50S ribosomal protein L29 [Candidatus Acidoferrales bacterium]